MENQNQLKGQLSTLLHNNPETFADTLNEIFTEEWLKDTEDELLMVSAYSSNWAEMLKNRITKEIGEKYTKSPSKFSTLLSAFVEAEVIEKSTDKEARKAIENNPQALQGIKEVVKHFDREQGEAW